MGAHYLWRRPSVLLLLASILPSAGYGFADSLLSSSLYRPALRPRRLPSVRGCSHCDCADEWQFNNARNLPAARAPALAAILIAFAAGLWRSRVVQFVRARLCSLARPSTSRQRCRNDPAHRPIEGSTMQGPEVWFSHAAMLSRERVLLRCARQSPTAKQVFLEQQQRQAGLSASFRASRVAHNAFDIA
uniref:Uncharacterized protein n=1 Tax=Calcidiscus leptoporus TaxID=127549 RepID=A0A7S0JAC7_9EUKA